MFKKMFALVVVVVVLLQLAIGPIEMAPPKSTGDDSCQLKAKEAKDCSLCCAIGGFNKFDSQGFQAGKGCHCFKDDAELAINQRHRPRKP